MTKRNISWFLNLHFALFIMRIIIGLGNPGEQYKNTRHNAGFMAVDFLSKKYNLRWEMNKKFNALICKYENNFIVKPLGFMNNSGQTANLILSYYKLLPKKLKFIRVKNSNLSDILTVIHDDVDIDFGKYKIAVNSRSAGHNGVQSIINYLKTTNFQRVRIGIRSENMNKMPLEKFVLQKFNSEELQTITFCIKKALNTEICLEHH